MSETLSPTADPKGAIFPRSAGPARWRGHPPRVAPAGRAAAPANDNAKAEAFGRVTHFVLSLIAAGGFVAAVVAVLARWW